MVFLPIVVQCFDVIIGPFLISLKIKFAQWQKLKGQRCNINDVKSESCSKKIKRFQNYYNWKPVYYIFSTHNFKYKFYKNTRRRKKLQIFHLISGCLLSGEISSTSQPSSNQVGFLEFISFLDYCTRNYFTSWWFFVIMPR